MIGGGGGGGGSRGGSSVVTVRSGFRRKKCPGCQCEASVLKARHNNPSNNQASREAKRAGVARAKAWCDAHPDSRDTVSEPERVALYLGKWASCSAKPSLQTTCAVDWVKRPGESSVGYNRTMSLGAGGTQTISGEAPFQQGARSDTPSDTASVFCVLAPQATPPRDRQCYPVGQYQYPVLLGLADLQNVRCLPPLSLHLLPLELCRIRHRRPQ